MGVKVLFALICIAVAEAKPTENNEDFNIVAVASNFATTDLDADRGKLPGKKLPLEVLKEMEANARKAGCIRGCLICLSHIKCTPKMKEVHPRTLPHLRRRQRVRTGRHRRGDRRHS